MPADHRQEDAGPARRRVRLLVGLGVSVGALLLVVALATAAGALTVPSIVLEDGSSTTIANDTLLLNGAIGGEHAGEIFLANGSTLTLYNVTVTFTNTTDLGGIRVEGGATLSVESSLITADSAATFGVVVSSSGVLRLNNSRLTSLQVLSDLSAAAILVRTGGEIHATDSEMRVHPDLRPLVDADGATLAFIRCQLTGSFALVRSTATFSGVTLSALGDVTAISASGSSVLIDNSTIAAGGGASGISAADISEVTVRSTNITAEDLGVSAVRASTVTFDGVIVLDAAFGLVADGGVFSGSNIGVYGTTTSMWLRNSQATLAAAQLGSGLIRLGSSTATLDLSGALLGPVVVADGSTLRLVDASFSWSQFAVYGGSFVVPEYTPSLRFHEAGGAAVAPGVNWSVFKPGGGLVGRGSSGIAGVSEGPALEGPRFDGQNFSQAPPYRVQYGRGTASFNSSTTAWGPSLVFDFYLDGAIDDLAFSGEGLQFSDQAPPVGGVVNASALLGFAEGGSPQSMQVTVWVDGVAQGQTVVQVNAGPFSNVTFELPAEAGIHLVEMAVDPPDAGNRGAVPERSERANNYVALWYNASANQTVSVRPDLVVSGFWFEYVLTTVRDPVTGESLGARTLVIHVNVSNIGLTGAGAFDMSVRAGINSSRVRLAGAFAGATTETNVSFGPYSRSEVIPIRVVLDVEDSVDEGNESNNVEDGTAAIVIPPLPPPERPIWTTVLVIAAAAGIVGLSLWGVRSAFRPEDDDVPPATTPWPASATSPSPPSAVGVPAPAPNPQATSAPSSSASAELPSATTSGPSVARPPPMGPPTAAYMPYGYPAPGYYPVQYPPSNPAPLYASPPAGPPPPPATSNAPPARCPRCGSAQLSYVLYPVRQVVCTACQNATLF